ncbi:MAG: hypothetical protein CME06_09745 [Gemmatimonadetes bacterium]|nr:hypothetical protein [Gemmatimonadota bacterium]
MRILLIHLSPPVEAPYPLGLALVAAALAPRRHELLVAETARSSPRIIAAQAAAGTVDLALVSIPRGCEELGCRMMGELIEARVPVAVSGPDVVLRSRAWARPPARSWAIVGEGAIHSWGALPIWSEATVVDLVDALTSHGDASAIPGAFSGEGELRLRPPDIELWPRLVADRTLFPVEDYCGGMLAHGYPYTALLSSRGCGLGCAYCPVPSTPTGRFVGRPAGSVAEEMLRLHRDHGVRSIHIEDDRFAADAGRVSLFSSILRKQGAPVAWELPNGIRVEDAQNEALLEQMASAGCVALTLSVEAMHSGSATDAAPWSEGIERVETAVRKCKRAGIKTEAYFIIGLPGNTESDLRRMLREARRLPLDGVLVSVFDRVPGSLIPPADDSELLPARLAAIRRSSMIRCYSHPRRLALLFAELIKHPGRIAVLGRKMRTLYPST